MATHDANDFVMVKESSDEYEMIDRQCKSISDFDDKLLTEIFAHLPLTSLISVEGVNKRWKRASLAAWSKKPTYLDIYFTEVFQPRVAPEKFLLPSLKKLYRPDVWPRVKDRRSGLQILVRSHSMVDMSSHIACSVFKRYGTHLTDLQLNFGNVHYSGDVFRMLAEHCTELKYLYVINATLTPYGVGFLAKCAKLEFLYLKNVAGDFEHELGRVFECTTRLRRFTAIRCPRITGSCLKQIRSLAFEDLVISKCDDFEDRHLLQTSSPARSLNVYSYCSSTQPISAGLIEELSHVTWLALEVPEGVTNDILVRIGKHCPMLKDLNVVLADEDDLEAGLNAIFDLPALTTLILTNAERHRTHEILSRRKTRIGQLKSLDLWRFEPTVKDLANIVKLSSLEKLVLGNCILPCSDTDLLDKLNTSVWARPDEATMQLKVVRRKTVLLKAEIGKNNVQIFKSNADFSVFMRCMHKLDRFVLKNDKMVFACLSAVAICTGITNYILLRSL